MFVYKPCITTWSFTLPAMLVRDLNSIDGTFRPWTFIIGAMFHRKLDYGIIILYTIIIMISIIMQERSRDHCRRRNDRQTVMCSESVGLWSRKVFSPTSKTKRSVKNYTLYRKNQNQSKPVEYNIQRKKLLEASQKTLFSPLLVNSVY